MTPEQLTEFINKHSSIIESFRRSASNFQYEKNARRQKGKQFSEARLEHEVDLMVAAFIDNVYTKIKSGVAEKRLHPYESWVDFIETKNVLDSLEDDVSTIVFE
ncbi:hypothetical protein [Lacticaseibacillus sharpeae]|uniref:Uncharacterized protein n=1 Tax=Lacticaseibacillus sharpeae JCM 1186 = DSM 20505 TaxID=1291052 RepID=A0A0R1ZKR4_9LACO|nr:hypothetical protein [Lacticaseibacillus sharpeae]KRM54970.1 hypothetical protein FC18_GL001817 [Lacticaseibacillus sharpeae JCM 1186 = DSM 20505]